MYGIFSQLSEKEAYRKLVVYQGMHYLVKYFECGAGAFETIYTVTVSRQTEILERILH